MNTSEYSYIMVAFEVTTLLWFLLNSFGSAVYHSYVSSSMGSSSSECGKTPDAPCKGLDSLLNRTGQLEVVGPFLVLKSNATAPTDRHIVHLSAGMYVMDPTFVYGLSNWTLNGEGSVTFMMESNYLVSYYDLLVNLSGVEYIGQNFMRYPAALYFRSCSNVDVINIEFFVSHTVHFLSCLTIDVSSTVSIRDCRFKKVASHASAVASIHPLGLISFENCTVSNLNGASDGGDKALIIVEFGSNKDGSGEVLLSNLHIKGVIPLDYKPLLVDQLFSSAVSYVRLYDYELVGKTASAVLIQFLQDSSGNVFTMENSVIENVKPVGYHSPVTFDISGAHNNTVILKSCTFTSNSGHVGGAVALYFKNDSDHNKVCFSNCTFSNNSALYDGGAVFVGYLDDSRGIVEFYGCKFASNTAVFGGALLLHSEIQSETPDVTLIDSHFSDNSASDGIVYVLRVTVKINGMR